LAAAVLVHLPSLVLTLRIVERTFLPDRLWGVLGMLGQIFFVLGAIALLLGMREVAEQAKARIPWTAGGALAVLWVWDFVYWQFLRGSLGFRFDSSWQFMLVAIEAAETILFLSLIDALANALEKPKAVPATEWGQNAGWQLAADGLRAYTSALLGRIY